ncbi:hypothetical protein FB45DRAFT_933077 [Roridomyces roridus]|uniref:Uncharacterized protein n=1 Tax=Roridomyces roridus TaxID=1738132 RepID=A0AAD7BDF8_9AGAR|nr:hypothetical protein FB45DRAFT_933077 [Roridomyces roridus]
MPLTPAMVKTAGTGALRPATTMLARRRASAKYRENNVEELREKARERMQRLRDNRKATQEGLEAQQAHDREASRKYRLSHAAALAHKQRIRRMDAFEKKHGHKAWVARADKLAEQRRIATEEEEWCMYEIELRRREREREERAAAESLQSFGAR